MSLRSLAAIVTFVAAFGAAPSASAVVREIGTPEPFQNAGCPDNCQAVGQVSGFQKQIGEFRNPFRSNREGHVVAFTIRLGSPNAEQMQFFQNFFGGPPSARLPARALPRLDALVRARKSAQGPAEGRDRPDRPHLGARIRRGPRR